MKKIKEKMLEIVKIAQECPENLQKSCFEILLKYELGILVNRGRCQFSQHESPTPAFEINWFYLHLASHTA